MTAGPLVVAVLGRGIVDPGEPVIHADDRRASSAASRSSRRSASTAGGRSRSRPTWTGSVGQPNGSGSRCPTGPRSPSLAGDAIAAAGTPDCSLRFTLTGGRETLRDPVLTVTIQALPPDLEPQRERGIKVIALQLGIDPRLRRDAPWLLDGVKSTSYAVNMAAWAEARRRGADDAIFLAADGSVLEGPVTNIWWRRERTLFTPALDLGILAGVTRATLLDLAQRSGYEVREGWFPVAEMAAADEAFTSSSVREVMPIVRLDGLPDRRWPARPGRVDLQASLRRLAGG